MADLMHYLDDFITAGPADSLLCSHNLQTSLAVCRSLGLPLHPNKCIGPSTRSVVLGIELDSLDQTARLPAEKLKALQELIQSWRTRRWCNIRQLESLIGPPPPCCQSSLAGLHLFAPYAGSSMLFPHSRSSYLPKL